MRKWHLALDNRPEPDVLARRWFTYLIAGVAAAIVGILVLLNMPNPQLKMKQDEVLRGSVAPSPQPGAPAAPTAPPSAPAHPH